MTEFFLGGRTRHEYAIEDATYGQPNTASTWSWLGPVQKVTPKDGLEVEAVRSMDETDSRNVTDHLAMLKKSGFMLESYIQHGRLLSLAYGSDLKEGASPYTHTMTETDTLPSFSFRAGYQHTSPFIREWRGCTINKVDIVVSKGGFARYVADVIAQDVTKQTVFKGYQVTTDSMKKYPSKGSGSILPYQWFHTAVTINGVTYKNVDQVRMSLDNDLLPDPGLDNTVDNVIQQPIPQERNYDGAFTIKMSSSALWDLWDGEAYISTDPTVTLQRSTNDKMVFTITNAMFESAISPHDVGGKVVVIDLPFKCEKITCVETNAISTDYDTAEA